MRLRALAVGHRLSDAAYILLGDALETGLQNRTLAAPAFASQTSAALLCRSVAWTTACRCGWWRWRWAAARLQQRQEHALAQALQGVNGGLSLGNLTVQALNGGSIPGGRRISTLTVKVGKPRLSEPEQV
jgi:hypothetical protein